MRVGFYFLLVGSHCLFELMIFFFFSIYILVFFVCSVWFMFCASLPGCVGFFLLYWFLLVRWFLHLGAQAVLPLVLASVA